MSASRRASSGFYRLPRSACRAVAVVGVLIAGGCSEISSNEYWLEQYAGYRNEWDRVARVFGFHDDLEGCEMIVKALGITQPKAQYRCVAVD